MASSAVEVCNIALVGLGANTINDLGEGSTEANACNVLWNSVRKQSLRLHPWNFAVKRVELPQEATTPTYEFAYQYVLPADCLKLLDVNGVDQWRVENRRILTNETECFIKYVSDIEDVSVWDEAFVGVVAARLHLDLAYTLTTSNTNVNTAWELYRTKLQMAKALDAAEDTGDDLAHGRSALIGVRF